MSKLTRLYLQLKTHIVSFISTIWSRLGPPPPNDRRVETVAEAPTKPATE